MRQVQQQIILQLWQKNYTAGLAENYTDHGADYEADRLGDYIEGHEEHYTSDYSAAILAPLGNVPHSSGRLLYT